MTVTSKLPDVGTTIFTVTTDLAAEYDAVNLSQGFPDFDPPPELIERVNWHMRTGRNQYAPMQGVALLRERIASKVADIYGNPIDSRREIAEDNRVLRFCFAKNDETLEQAAERLCRI